MTRPKASTIRYLRDLERSLLFCPEGHGIYIENPEPGRDYPCPTCNAMSLTSMLHKAEERIAELERRQKMRVEALLAARPFESESLERVRKWMDAPSETAE